MLSRRMFSRCAAIASGAGLVAALGATPAEQAGSASYSPPAGALIPPGETPQLTLMYTGDVIGYIEPCG